MTMYPSVFIADSKFHDKIPYGVFFVNLIITIQWGYVLQFKDAGQECT